MPLKVSTATHEQGTPNSRAAADIFLFNLHSNKNGRTISERANGQPTEHQLHSIRNQKDEENGTHYPGIQWRANNIKKQNNKQTFPCYTYKIH